MGSPPLTRGKVPRRKDLCQKRRITPAYAGKRRFWVSDSRHTGDHPRLRGEKEFFHGFHFLHSGSPPLTRGKEAQPTGNMSNFRITPAYAGKRRIAASISLPNWDHPRLRGEKFSLYAKRCICRGSPPLTRGKEDQIDVAARRARITPAYAGKRVVMSRPVVGLEDHPRLRGEK